LEDVPTPSRAAGDSCESGMIYAFHRTRTTYGHWFPNDPRGSRTEEMWQPQLAADGKLDPDRFRLEPREIPQDQVQASMNTARTALRYSAVQLDSAEINVVGAAFEEIVQARNLRVLALAILPHHVHILLRRPVRPYERVVNALKGRSAQRVREHRGLCQAACQRNRVPVRTRGYWVRHVPDDRVAEGVAASIEQNPAKHGLPPQKWAFVEGS